MVSQIVELKDRIKQLREELIQIAKTTGLNSSETLRCGRKLDELITTYQKSKNQQIQKFD
ncbi:hypothetical protein QFZ28_005867 [Neobacillus niacini]|uniref:aspartyl-phosphate phosphatase Spo0E family protein n=1 Tax=Neobacillus niacini TaxID=86668 RepID=UPI0027818639|nr:aspartyl-phosphate phosphatase Spo0E family protein [Neobacillus niacini]MDQ1005289.1 hypothetical protein [Neobacillus niacini]